MSLTIGNWFFIGLVLLTGICISLGIYHEWGGGWEKHPKGAIINMIITLIIIIAIALGLNWYNTSTASGMRSYKDFQSELSNGIYRELVITAEDGREIFRYEGKFDIERHENGDDRYLRFESQEGKRYTISYGIQDTVIIIEKDKIEE